jgi:hypothetical protein
MNPQKSPEITVQTLLALRKEEDAVRLITERLRVKEMGPADHIRTKHEVKAFVESMTGNGEAEKIIRDASMRRSALGQSQTIDQRQKRSNQMKQ